MNTLIINGSPRKNGATSSIINRFTSLLTGEISIVDTYRCEVKPCVDCRHCWTKSGCAINDPMQEIYRKIDEADNIIIASPIYFAELTGSLLNWASRLQYLWVSQKFRGEKVITDKLRKGFVVLVDGGDGNSDTALAMAKRLLRTMGAEYQSLIYFSGTDKPEHNDPLKDLDTVDAIYKITAELA